MFYVRGLGTDDPGFVISFAGGDSEQSLVLVRIHTNDPDLWANYSRYTDAQFARLRKHAQAATYVAYKAAQEKIQAIQ